MNREEVRKKIIEIGLVPSVRVETADAAIFAAEHILAGGIPIVEVAATIPGSPRVVEELRKRFPSIIVGAEVLFGLDEAHRLLDSGALFLTGPGFDPEIVSHCSGHGTVVIPGALTPTEVMFAHRAGADFVKVFPCADVGGEKYIRALKAPMPHVAMMAAGGVTQNTAEHYIAAGADLLGVGEDMIPHQAIRLRDGAWIRELASRFLKFVSKARAERR